MQPGVGRIEFLVCLVTDRDHQWWHLGDVVDRSWLAGVERELGALGRGDRTGIDTVGRMCARRLGRKGRRRSPQRCGELAASRVASAHEQRPCGDAARPGLHSVEGRALEVYVPAASIPARPRSVDHSDLLEHVEVVSQQVGLDADQPSQLNRGSIRRDEFVDDHQPNRIGEGCIAVDTDVQVGSNHPGNILLKTH